MKYNIATTLLLSLALSACGGSDDNDIDTDNDTDSVCVVDCDSDSDTDTSTDSDTDTSTDSDTDTSTDSDTDTSTDSDTDTATDTDTDTSTDSDTDTSTDSDTDTSTDSDTDTATDTDTDTSTDSDTDTSTDSDTDTSTDSDTDTGVTDDFDSYSAGTQIDVANSAYSVSGVDGSTTFANISDTVADTANNSLYLEDASGSGKPVVSRAFTDGAADAGSISVSVYIPTDGYVKSSYIYLGTSDSASSSSRFTEVSFGSSEVKFRNAAGTQVAIHDYEKNTWVDVTIAWDNTDVTVTVDGTEYTTFDDGSGAQAMIAENDTGSPSLVALYVGDGGTTGTYTYFDNLDINIGAEDETPTTYDGVPYDYERYQDALDNANLQQTDLSNCSGDDINASCSKSDVVSAGGYADYESEYFYIDETSGWLTFEMQGDSNRTELRFTENFLTNLEDTSYTMSAEILPINPTESVESSTDGEEITLLQVHNKGENAETDSTVLSHPLLRITWDGEERTDDSTGESYTGAYWAVIKTNAYECSDDSKDAYNADCPDSYDRYYLGDYDSTTATKFDVKVYNSQLIIDIDDVNKVTFDIDYWSHLYSYFKAGVYNQYESDGSETSNSVIQFKTITYTESTVTDYGLDTSLPPSSNFDLSTWNLSVPIDSGDSNTYAKATTITVEKLNDGYELTDYFWTDTTDGGMVFKDYIDGARTSENTTYTRTELREMLRGEDTSISTQGVNGNNWVFSSVPESQQLAAGGVDGYMKATLAVNAVTTTGKSSYVGRVIVGQIHAASDEPIRIYYRLLPGHTKGSIYFAHEPSNGNDEQWYEMIGSKSDSASEPSDGIELDEKFSYEIDVVGDTMTVTITREDGTSVEQVVDMSDSGYSDGYYDKDGDGVDETEDYMYFKAGVYNQNKLVDEDEDGVDDNGAEADDFVQATFYELITSHN